MEVEIYANENNKKQIGEFQGASEGLYLQRWDVG
jgi:hypothetical protein